VGVLAKGYFMGTTLWWSYVPSKTQPCCSHMHI